MKKLLSILLGVIIIGCNGGGENFENSLKKYDFNEIYFLKPSTEEHNNNYYWILPTTKIFLKSNDEMISEGVIQKYNSERDELQEKYINKNITYKLVFKKLGTIITDTNFTITSSMELISGNKWVEKEYYSNGILQEYEEFIFFNGDFCKNGIERLYYKNGQLKGDCINYSPDCGDPFDNSPVCKRYYITGQLKSENQYNIKEERVIYERCWDEDGNETECE